MPKEFIEDGLGQDFGSFTATQGCPLGTSLERSLANGIDGLSGCGTGTMILFLLLVISVVINVLQQRNTSIIVRTVLRAALNKEDPPHEEDQ